MFSFFPILGGYSSKGGIQASVGGAKVRGEQIRDRLQPGVGRGRKAVRTRVHSSH